MFDTKLSCLNEPSVKMVSTATHFPQGLWNEASTVVMHFVLTLADFGQAVTFSTDPDRETLHNYKGVTKNIGLFTKKLSAYADSFTDPNWRNQWYMHDYRTKAGPVMDHNIVPVYKMGFTGKGIKIAVIDDGFEHTHPDIKPNYLRDLSYDVCRHKPNPRPEHDEESKINSHGTKIMGVIAMVPNNTNCGVGIAHGAKIAGIKHYCKNANEYVSALSLYHKQDEFDISNNSWGPDDDGKDETPMNSLVETALNRGIKSGRGGKGLIFMFPSGNGRTFSDDCGWDAIVNYPGNIVIAAATNKGKVTKYGERCAGVPATVYSGDPFVDDTGLVAPNVGESCTTKFVGTSAAVPLASGIIALVLQANSSLTYRDVMHIVTMGSEVAPLADNANTWYRNGKGFWVSNDFGFGLLNALNMVKLALSWVNVPEERVCKFTVKPDTPIPLKAKHMATITFDTEACEGTADEVNYLEIVEVSVKVDYPRRGALSMYLTSPSKTRTTLLEPRVNDTSSKGLDNWRVKATHFWGENPRHSWTVEVGAVHHSSWWRVFSAAGKLHQFTITLRGTVTPPFHYDQLPRRYAGFRLPDGQTSEDTLTVK